MQDATTAPVKYASVNGAWPTNLPPITDQEAVALVKRLYRFAMKRPLKIPVKITTGNRETWVRRGVFYVNPKNRTALQAGWHDMVHSVSHYCTVSIAVPVRTRPKHSSPPNGIPPPVVS